MTTDTATTDTATTGTATGEAAPAPKEDHRKRVARERRTRMEAHLLRSVMEVYPESRDGRAVIDDVIRHAAVSRGTFYQYFPSLDAAVTRLAARFADEMLATVAAVYQPLDDPRMRTACGFQIYLLRALIDRRWGAFLTHIGLFRLDNAMVSQIADDIAMGVGTGDYDVASVAVAADLLLGAKVEAIGRIIGGEADLPYIHAMTAHVLRSFGIPAKRAERIVQEAYEVIRRDGPAKIPWWPERCPLG